MKKPIMAGILVIAGLAASSALAFPLTKPTDMPHNKLPVVRVQATDAEIRVQQLEDTVRQLNGRVEEMSFQLLQMQELIRKTQEDNEYRFQELENGKGAGKGTGKKASLDAPVLPPSTDTAGVQTPAITDVPVAGIDAAPANDPTVGVLGAVVFDANGNPVPVTTPPSVPQDSLASAQPTPDVPAGAGLPLDLSGAAASQTAPDQQTASVGSNSEEVYKTAYNYILSGDYKLAEQGFQTYLSTFPEGERSADASFWLGEAEYSQGNFNEAAKTFLNAHQAYGKSPKAPEMLLKLGMSLAELDDKDTACATLREVTKRYPNASKPVKAKVASEQSRLAC
jgi:tol-pal system protein YbgF